ncbi:MAG: MBL fold metallo-hydrolase [Ruminococcaceae bacterium]|nr:MBL fold metallo-hydrolase [Oscillospiraceae bacterium]
MNLKEQILNTQLLDSQAALWYLGQESMLVKCMGKYLLFDPYLSDYVDRVCSSEEILWKRRYPVPIDPAELDFVDYVFLSHDHEDHCDPDTLTPIAANNKKAKYFCPPNAKGTLNRCGIDDKDIVFCHGGNAIDFGDIKVSPMPAAHEELHYDANGDFMELGYYVTVGDITFFHSGDMCPYAEMDKYMQKCNVAMIATNGRDAWRLANGIEGNFNSSEAIDFALKMNADLLVPMHFDLYDVNSVPMGELADTMEKEKKFIAHHVFMPGERYVYMR